MQTKRPTQRTRFHTIFRFLFPFFFHVSFQAFSSSPFFYSQLCQHFYIFNPFFKFTFFFFKQINNKFHNLCTFRKKNLLLFYANIFSRKHSIPHHRDSLLGLLLLIYAKTFPLHSETFQFIKKLTLDSRFYPKIMKKIPLSNRCPSPITAAFYNHFLPFYLAGIFFLFNFKIINVNGSDSGPQNIV